MTETETAPHYRRALARIHHEGYTFQANRSAPGIVKLLEPVLERRGVVLELGCGTGLLTRHLVEAGHRVVATDASADMLDIAREELGDRADLHLLALPDDPLPACDAVVGIGQVLGYLPDEAAIDRALVAIAEALRPGGILALDVLGRRFADAFPLRRTDAKVTDDWAIISRLDVAENRFINEHTSFVPDEDGNWQREDERHVNILVDTERIPGLLAEHGVEVQLGEAFAHVKATPPPGLVTITGHRPA